MPMTNAELWARAQKKSGSFATLTAQNTALEFSEKGFTQMQTTQGILALNEFWNVMMPYTLQLVNISHAKDYLESAGVGETYTEEYGQYVRRIATESVKPVNPAYIDLVDGEYKSPFVIRKPKINDRFFEANFDYQSWITMPDEWMTKRIFASDFGFSELLAGVMAGVENGYIAQKVYNKLEAINSAIHDASLSESQTLYLNLPESPTSSDYAAMQLKIYNLIERMLVNVQTGAFNMLGFRSVQEPGRLKLLVRPGYKGTIIWDVIRNSFHIDQLNLGVDVVVVENFGGIEYYADEEHTEKLYPVYSPNGEMIGFDTEEGSDTVTVQESDAYPLDPNADVMAVLMDKGFIFHTIRNGYIVEPIRNPRQRYNNYWASAPNNAIHYDRLYNFVVIREGSEPVTPAPEPEPENPDTPTSKARAK